MNDDCNMLLPENFDIGIIHDGSIKFTIVAEFSVPNMDENGSMKSDSIHVYINGEDAHDIMAAREMMQSLDAGEDALNVHARSVFIKHWRINNAPL